MTLYFRPSRPCLPSVLSFFLLVGFIQSRLFFHKDLSPAKIFQISFHFIFLSRIPKNSTHQPKCSYHLMYRAFATFTSSISKIGSSKPSDLKTTRPAVAAVMIIGILLVTTKSIVLMTIIPLATAKDHTTNLLHYTHCKLLITPSVPLPISTRFHPRL